MAPTMGEALIVTALAAALVAYLYFKHRERSQRTDIIHQERLAAMDKGIPLPEIPHDPPQVPKPEDPREMLLHGIVWAALGAGGMLALALIGGQPNTPAFWALPLPLVFLGIGLILYYVLASDRAR